MISLAISDDSLEHQMRPVGIPSCSTTLTWRDCGRRGSEKLKEQGKQSALGIHKYTETRIYYDFIFF
jgi:hypothetical protein